MRIRDAGLAVIAVGLLWLYGGCATNDRNTKSIVNQKDVSAMFRAANLENSLVVVGNAVDSKLGRGIARLTSARGIAESLEYKPKPSPQPTFDQLY